MALPGFLLRGVMALLRWLDRVNLMPAAMIASDPMYASAFLANLGSLGIDDTFHHLFEYGTVSLFGAVGRAEKALFVGADGAARGARRAQAVLVVRRAHQRRLLLRLVAEDRAAHRRGSRALRQLNARRATFPYIRR